MLTDFKSIEFRLHEYLVQIQDILFLLGFEEDLVSQILESKELLKTKKYKIAVMGEFNRGKSSLINALLGSKILPSDVTPTTATINRITYGTKSSIIISYKDGQSAEINISELSDYVTKLTPEGEIRASKIKEAIVLAPTIICQNHVEIIDTPGLNDDEHMTKITIGMLDNIDAVIVAISARSPFSETEKNFVCQLVKSENIHNIIFTVTFIDQLDEDDTDYDRFLEFIKKRIYNEVLSALQRENDENVINLFHRKMDHLFVFGISASQALKAFVSNDRALLKKSMFEEFKTELLKITTSKQIENAMHKSHEAMRKIVSEFDNQYNINFERLDTRKKLIEFGSNQIKDYLERSNMELDLIFQQNETAVNSAVSELNSQKNVMVNLFIKNLSSVKINSHEEIAKSISDASLQCYEIINGEIRDNLNEKIISFFKVNKEELSKTRKENIWEHFYALGMTDNGSINPSKNIENVMANTKTRIEKIQFNWKVPPVIGQDLTKCNPINNIVNAIDISIKQLINEYHSTFSDIKQLWYAYLATENDSVTQSVQNQKNKQLNEIETQIQIFNNNFYIQKDNAAKILEKSEQLLQEFYQ